MIISAGKQDVEMRLSIRERIEAILITLANHNTNFRLFVDNYCLAMDVTFQDMFPQRRLELVQYAEKPGDGKFIAGMRTSSDGVIETRVVPDSGVSEEEVFKLLEQFVLLLILAQYQPPSDATGTIFS